MHREWSLSIVVAVVVGSGGEMGHASEREARERSAPSTEASDSGATPNAFCRVVRVAIDRDLDGTPDAYRARWYDDQGHEIREMEDRDGDGEPDELRVWSYQNDRRVRRKISYGGGEWDGITTWTYEEGRKVKKEADNDPDGQTDEITTWRYDDQGRKSRRVRQGSDGTIEEVTAWTYEPREEGGHVVRKWRDRDQDGRAEGLTRTVYDAEGREVDKFERRRPGGDDEAILKWAYDDRGNVLRFVRHYAGNTLEETCEYDDQGRKVRIEAEVGLDESPDYTATWTYDERGNPVGYKKDAGIGEDGHDPSKIKTWRYIPKGCVEPD